MIRIPHVILDDLYTFTSKESKYPKIIIFGSKCPKNIICGPKIIVFGSFLDLGSKHVKIIFFKNYVRKSSFSDQNTRKSSFSDQNVRKSRLRLPARGPKFWDIIKLYLEHIKDPSLSCLGSFSS